ncbi:Hypothetical predicted protein [Marmota monax]|uniref:BOS complex subunit TMEM147 n=1 Tax=Marmota monax TaxID=9995 RepID=A0A5E4AEN0_MARMO|nr:Hypothetical predicted protein [Marmota monax]
MTLFHFGNCFALAYFPYFITYKCSGLSEYNAFWKCVQAGVTYLFVQLCKVRAARTPRVWPPRSPDPGTRLCRCPPTVGSLSGLRIGPLEYGPQKGWNRR